VTTNARALLGILRSIQWAVSYAVYLVAECQAGGAGEEFDYKRAEADCSSHARAHRDVDDAFWSMLGVIRSAAPARKEERLVPPEASAMSGGVPDALPDPKGWEFHESRDPVDCFAQPHGALGTRVWRPQHGSTTRLCRRDEAVFIPDMQLSFYTGKDWLCAGCLAHMTGLELEEVQDAADRRRGA
jgi:hypothetical protein